MPAPVLWEPNDELKNLIRAGMSKIGQVYDKGESLYNQYAPSLVKETMHMWANQPQGLIPDMQGNQYLEAATRLDNIVPFLAKSLPALGAALGMAAKGGGKTSRSIDEVWGLVASDPKWEKAFNKALKLTDKYFPDVPNSLDEILDVARSAEKTEDFLPSIKTRFTNRQIDLARVDKVGKESSLSDEVGEGLTKEQNLAAPKSDIPSTEMANPQTAGAEANEASLEGFKQVRTAKAVTELDWNTFLRGKIFSQLAKRGSDLAPLRTVKEKGLTDAAGNAIKDAVSYKEHPTNLQDKFIEGVSASGRPYRLPTNIGAGGPSNVSKDLTPNWIGSLTERYGMAKGDFDTKARYANPEYNKGIADRARAITNFKREDFGGTQDAIKAQLGPIKAWYSRNSIGSQLAPVLEKHGATPEEAAAIHNWVAGPAATYKSLRNATNLKDATWVVSPKRIKQLFVDSIEDLADVRMAQRAKEAATTKELNQRIRELSNLPKEALFGLLSKYGPVRNRTSYDMKQQLIKKIREEFKKGYTK